MKTTHLFAMLIGAVMTLSCGSDSDSDSDDTILSPNLPATSTDPIATEVIDLGLSVKWCGHNVGAASPEDASQFSAENPSRITSENMPASDYKWWGDSRYDYATYKMGSKWRTPTDEEWQELCDKCTWEWGTYKGVSGYYVKSKTKGTKMFLPVVGSPKDGFDFSMYFSASIVLVGYIEYIQYLKENLEQVIAGGGSAEEIEAANQQIKDFSRDGACNFFYIARGVHQLDHILPYNGNVWTDPSTRKTYTFKGAGNPAVQCCRAVCN